MLTVQQCATIVEWFYAFPTAKGSRELKTTVHHWLVRAWLQISFVVIFMAYLFWPIFKATRFCKSSKTATLAETVELGKIDVSVRKSLQQGKNCYGGGILIAKFFPFAWSYFSLARVLIDFEYQ